MNPKDLPTPEELPAYDQIWRKAYEALEDIEKAMNHHLGRATEMRNLLLGINPTAEKIEQINRMFREQGYLLPDDVI